MERILVTGASGFTGSHLCRRLRQDGKQVVAFVRKTSRMDSLQKIGVECRIVDIGDKDGVFQNFQDISMVYHIAAAFRVEHADKEEFFRINVEATRHLLEAAFQNGVKRFVHCSTVGVQGEIDDPPADEEYRYQPGDIYQETKMQGEMVAKEYIQKGYPVSVVRPTGIYGPGDTRFLKLFKAINKGRFLMVGSGKALYHLTYIDDLIKGFLLAGKREEAIGKILAIGGPSHTTLAKLVEMIADVLGKPHPRFKIPYAPVYWSSVLCEKLCHMVKVNPPLYPRRVKFFSKDRAFDITKAKNVLGYESMVDLSEGLRRTADWYKSEGLLK